MYESADSGGPPTYFGKLGNEHSGKLRPFDVTTSVFAGASFCSTHFSINPRRSNWLGIGVTGMAFPAPFIE